MSDRALLQVENLTKHFRLRRGLLDTVAGRQAIAHAVDGVSFHVNEGEAFGLAGASGSGKSTIAKIVSLLEQPTSGTVKFDNVDILNLRSDAFKRFRQRVQMIFQNPYESIDPRYTVSKTVEEPLIIHGIGSPQKRKELVSEFLTKVGLEPKEYSDKFPYQLSGGERQRVAIARAMILKPAFVVADEPVSMLDACVRGGVMELLLELRRSFNFSYLWISHDLAIIRYMTQRIAVMFLGKICETGPTSDVIAQPLHPYTRALLIALEPEFPGGLRIKGTGELPSSVNPPEGCRFHPVCSLAEKICASKEPLLEEKKKHHYAACHFA